MSKKKWFGILFITLFSIFITFFLSKKDSSYLYSDTSDFFSLQEGKGYQGPDWNVWPGQYTFTFTYSASHNIPFSFFADKEVLLEGVFNPCTGGSQRVTLVVPQRTDRFMLGLGHLSSLFFNKSCLFTPFFLWKAFPPFSFFHWPFYLFSPLSVFDSLRMGQLVSFKPVRRYKRWFLFQAVSCYDLSK